MPRPRTITAGPEATRAETVTAERRRRRGDTSTSGLRLQFDRSLMDEEKYVYRVINDDGVKLHRRTVEDDYELVDDPAKKIKSDGTDLGTKASIVVGRTEDGRPIRGYLARKRRDYYEADQREKREASEATMKAIATPQIPADKAYTPTSRSFEKE